VKIVFMGTPDFAVPSLQALYDAGHEIAGVFTQPDRPAGRGNRITASPVKSFAESMNLRIFQPEKIKNPEAVESVIKLEPDCLVVVAYGQVLPPDILEYPKYGCVNVHASLLPAYRGAAPIHWAVINGDTKTGVTTMLMDQGLDTGDMLLYEEIPLDIDSTMGEIHDVLKITGAKLLLKTLAGLENKTIVPVPQPAGFTYAPLIKREIEKIDWSWDAGKIHNRIRGLSPWPGAFTTFRGEQIKIWKSRPVDPDKSIDSMAGEIVLRTADGIKAATGKGYIEITELQPAGRKRMAAADFYNGRKVNTGEIFI